MGNSEPNLEQASRPKSKSQLRIVRTNCSVLLRRTRARSSKRSKKRSRETTRQGELCLAVRWNHRTLGKTSRSHNRRRSVRSTLESVEWAYQRRAPHTKEQCHGGVASRKHAHGTGNRYICLMNFMQFMDRVKEQTCRGDSWATGSLVSGLCTCVGM